MLEDVVRRSLSSDRIPRESTQFLDSLHVDELLLARACARGDEAAWEQFLGFYREKLYRAATAIARSESIGRELADSVYADLYGTRLREDGSRISKLDSYMGRGSLEGWLRTVLAQDYVNRFRSERRSVSFVESIDTRPHESAISETAELTHATDAALAALSSEERFLLAAYYLDGRTLAEIGRMLGAHESTVSRRLEKITASLRKQIIKKLCESGIARREAEQMLDVDVRELNMNVREGLTQERRSESI